MNRRWLLAAAVLAVVPASRLAAQARRSLSVIPTVGYTLPTYKWVEDPAVEFKPGGGLFVGLTAEYSLNKSFSLAAHGLRTFGLTQTFTVSFPGQGEFESDMTTTQLAGGIVFRPLGRLPSGAPKSVYMEAGAGLTLFSVATGFTAAADSFPGFKASSPFVMGGMGLSFPAGPRFSIQVFGRAQYLLSNYSSDFLDYLNAPPPLTPTPLEGKKGLMMQFGLGLRVGR
jgi:hypothetical protein